MFCKAGFVRWAGPGTERERGVATSHFQSHKDKGSAKKTIFQIAKNCFVRKARFHPIAQKGKSTKGICTFISDPRIAEQKTSHFIPQSVHSTSFHRGNAEKQFYRAWKMFFLQSQVCWWVGVATEREELQHLFSSLTKAAPKRQFIRSRKNCFVRNARFHPTSTRGHSHFRS